MQKTLFQIGQVFLKSWLKKLKLVCHGMFISDLNGGELVGTLYEKRIVKNKSGMV